MAVAGVAAAAVGFAPLLADAAVFRPVAFGAEGWATAEDVGRRLIDVGWTLFVLLAFGASGTCAAIVARSPFAGAAVFTALVGTAVAVGLGLTFVHVEVPCQAPPGAVCVASELRRDADPRLPVAGVAVLGAWATAFVTPPSGTARPGAPWRGRAR